MDIELRTMGGGKAVKFEWDGRVFEIRAIPLSQIDRLAADMDKLVKAGVEKMGKEDFFRKLFAERKGDVIARLRLFLTMPPETDDTWLEQHLTIPRLVWIDEQIAEVNQLEYVGSFFGVPGSLIKKAPEKAAPEKS